MSGIEFTSRYDVFGPPNGCASHCEGTGWIPLRRETADNARLAALWEDAHRTCSTLRRGLLFWVYLYRGVRHLDRIWFGCAWDKIAKPCDGWHFVRCPDCSAEKGK